MCLDRSVHPVVTETSSPNAYEHYRTPSADCKVLEQAVRRFASHDRSTAVCNVSCGVAAPLSEYFPTFRRIIVPSSQRDKQPKKNELLALLTVKAKALRCFETSGRSGPATKNGLRGLLDLEVVFFLYLLILTYCLLFLLFSSCILLSLSSCIPSLDLPYVFPSFILSFHFALFYSVFPASLLLPLFLLISYFTLPHVSGSGAISLLRNVPSSATVISEVVKLTVEFLATLFLLQTTDSRSLAFKAGFLQFLHS